MGSAVQPLNSTEPGAGPPSWFEPSLPHTVVAREPPDEEAFARLWHSFMTARVLMALAIGLLQLLAYLLGQPLHAAVPLLCIGYLAATLAVRLLARPERPEQTFGRQWLFTAGIDLLVYSLLQLLQPGTLNYTPLYALPLLLVSVLGSLMLALGTAAGITLLLLADAWGSTLNAPDDAAARLLAAALIASGYFVVALLVNQLASRLAREQRRSRRSHLAASLQSQVNELVIDALADGVSVVDRDGVVRAANPAARLLLGSARGELKIPFALAAEPAWWPLLDLVHEAFNGEPTSATEVLIQHAGQGQRRLRVRTRLTSSGMRDNDSLCVLFLHDLRETEARLRTEKLAAMGRMSSAVAHEIRNPLAAIVQANALLDEDIHDPAQKRLLAMVRQNAQRLARIIEEVLDISRVQQQLDAPAEAVFALDAAVRAICDEWSAHRDSAGAVHLALSAGEAQVRFDPEHLRRVLVNLLDNGRRHAGPHPDSLQVSTGVSEDGELRLSVWSDGAPLEPAVEQHLFEPFFSSQSRSTGLGLYICRELCERHAAQIGYRREPRATARGEVAGNVFAVAFARVTAAAALSGRPQPDINLAS